MSLYSDKVMDHFEHPRNVGVIEDADGIGEVGNAKCGDIMRMYLKIDDDVISDVKFETFGCGSAIASSSMATELIKGRPVSEAMQLTNKAVAEALDGLPAYKMHCSVLAEEAIKAALKDYYDRNGIAYDASTEQWILWAGRPSSASATALLVSWLTSERGLPLMSSVAMELDAMALPQPKVSNFTSVTMSFSIFRYIFMMSPHLALPT